MKAFRAPLILFLLAFAEIANASTTSTIQEFFNIDADDLIIRPLTLGDKKKTMEIEGPEAMSKYVQMFKEDTADAPSPQKVSRVLSNQRSMLNRDWTILQDSESLERLQLGEDPKLYLGVFEKKTEKRGKQEEMVGVVNIGGFTKRGDYLWFEYMFDPHMRGKGYGTRSVQIVTEFLETKKIIAKNVEDTENFPYRGIKAIVDFENKPSLVVLLDKCHFQISGFEGCFVELVHPPQVQTEAHDELKPRFDLYLKRPPVKTESRSKNLGKMNKENEAETAQEEFEREQTSIHKELVQTSFKRLIALPLDKLKKIFCPNDYYFVVDALSDYPALCDLLDGEIKMYVREKITTYYNEEFKGKVALRAEERKEFNEHKKRFLNITRVLAPKRNTRSKNTLTHIR